MIRPTRRQRGFSMIELLVALVVTAFSLFGLAGLQSRSLSIQVDSETRRIAASMVAQLRERVTANQEGYGGALATGYSVTLAPGGSVTIPVCAVADACNAVTEVPTIQLALWLADVQRQLPGAAATIGATTAGSVASMTVTVGWIEPNATAVSADAACNGITAVATNVAYRCLTATFFPG